MRQARFLPIQQDQEVSILLVVELAFEAGIDTHSMYPENVSILLVVELAFEENCGGYHVDQFSGFNPSCSGIGF